MTKTEQPSDQYDSPWKEAIEEYFQDCMAFFFPKIHADIDWSKGYEFLDKELEKIVRQAVVTNQHVDKLVQVYRKSGEETWVLIHIDVQSQHETAFSKRMYQYNYRLFDRYDRPVVTLIIYGDESKKWRPQVYKRKLWDFEIAIRFPTVKLIEYDINALEQSDNPFAIVVLAHRHTKATKHQPETRYALRWRLTRLLYKRGYNRDRILSLYRYIEWLMALPKGLEQQFNQELAQYEEEQTVTYVIRAVREGIEQGIQQGIQQSEQKIKESEQKIKESEQKIKESEQKVLQIAREDVLEILMIRFDTLPESLIKAMTQVNELPQLKTLLKKAVTTESIARFEQFFADQLADNASSKRSGKPDLPDTTES